MVYITLSLCVLYVCVSSFIETYFKIGLFIFILVPSHPPENTTLVGNTSTSLNISWSAVPPEFVHGVLRGYVIEYWPVDDVNDTANTTVEPWKTEVEITNLKKFTNYTIKFAAMTAKGVGNWSEIIVMRTDEDSKFKIKIFRCRTAGKR